MSASTTRETVEEAVTEALVTLGAEPDAVGPDATFEELDIDSLDLVELSQIVEERFGVEIKGDEAQGLKTVRQAVDLVAARAG